MSDANAAADSWVDGATDASGWGPANLPYGVADLARAGGGAAHGGDGGPGAEPVPVVAIGTKVLDLRAAAAAGLLDGVLDEPAAAFAEPRLNPLLERTPAEWRSLRDRLTVLVTDESHRSAVEPLLSDRDQADMRLPFAVVDYVDFYSSLEHATNLGRLFRPDDAPLLPNWRHLPVGYHGRAGTVVVTGTPVRRPSGQRRPEGDSDQPGFGPSRLLDIELEVGFVTGGPPNSVGEPIPVDEAPARVFGYVLVNDWSARDIQAWEYQPLGPFLGKSFATSISAWVVPLDALRPHLVGGPPQDPEPLPYLRSDGNWNLDLELQVQLRSEAMAKRGEPPAIISQTNFSGMYWNMAQQLAHASVNGAVIRAGDLWASGTVSGSAPASEGSLIELTWRGERPLTLPGDEERRFLEDGDEVTLLGWCGGGSSPRISFGPVTGRILPA